MDDKWRIALARVNWWHLERDLSCPTRAGNTSREQFVGFMKSNKETTVDLEREGADDFITLFQFRHIMPSGKCPSLSTGIAFIYCLCTIYIANNDRKRQQSLIHCDRFIEVEIKLRNSIMSTLTRPFEGIFINSHRRFVN